MNWKLELGFKNIQEKFEKKTYNYFNLQVYARQKGFTFWPAKVIRVSNPERPDGGSYDVRFFGGYHQRAVVDKSSIRPITVSVSSLGIKR